MHRFCIFRQRGRVVAEKAVHTQRVNTVAPSRCAWAMFTSVVHACKIDLPFWLQELCVPPTFFGRKICFFLKKYKIRITTILFFLGADEFEKNCRVVEKCAFAPKTFGIVLATRTFLIRFSRLPEPLKHIAFE